MRVNVMVLCLVLFSLLTNCKSVNKAVDVRAKNISTEKIISNHQRSKFKGETYTATLHTEIQKPRNLSANIRLRAERDQVIWMSVSKLGINIAKFLATKDSVKFYNKLTKTYFEGDFSIVQQVLGASIDFYQLQNLLLGQAVVNLKSDEYKSSITSNNYQLRSKIKDSPLSYLFWVDPAHFKIKQQNINQKNPKRSMSVNYSEFQEVEGEFFPKKMQIISQSNDDMAAVNIDFRRVTIGNSLSFPFKFPENYQKISVK